jgi:hypothetical protein
MCERARLSWGCSHALYQDIEGTDEVATIPNSLGVCDEWWLFRPFNAPKNYATD